MKSRDLVKSTLEFGNGGRVPRHLWVLPWARMYEGAALQDIQRAFPDDIVWDMPVSYLDPPRTSGDMYEKGQYVDEWGCRFTSIHRGIIGEVKAPLFLKEEWEDAEGYRFPEELLTFDIDKVNAFYRGTDRFVVQTDFARVFERLQFLRGTENLYADIALGNEGLLRFMRRLHDFNCRLMERWAKTDVDALFMMDDWGSQNSLLINPEAWVRMFKPLYADYCAIARRHGKKIFMHSDGHTLAILPHLVEIGVDAANLQLFCIGLENLRPFKGKITFWGEIDRQWLLPHATAPEVREAVRDVRKTLWDKGGCVAQCEFGPGARPENVRAVFETWAEYGA